MLRSRLLPAAAGVALLIVLGVGAWWWLSPAPQTDVAVTTEPEADVPAEAAAESVPETAAEEPETETADAEPPAEGALQPQAGSPPEPDSEAAAEPEAAEATARWEEEETEPGATGGALEPQPEVAEATPRWEPDQEDEAGEAPAESATSQDEIIAQLTPGIAGAPATAEAEDAPASPVQAPDCPSDNAAPGCTLAAEALRTMVATPASAPAVNLNQPDGVYLDQDYLVVEMKLPEEVGGYVYVDVLTDAGSVYHLLPEPLRADNQLQAGGVMRVGVEAEERREGVRHWQVSEPFGDAYLLVLVSENPVYEDLRPIAEPLESYRDVLLEALADPATGAKSVHLRRIEFRPR